MSQRTAILLLAHGTPDKLSEMSEYLQKVTGGRPMGANTPAPPTPWRTCSS